MKAIAVFVALQLNVGGLFASEFTNRLAVFLIADNVPRESIINGTASLAGVKLSAEPVIKDSDWVSYTVTNHDFVITQSAADRLAELCKRELQVPFVVVALGERIYVGVFTSSFSSMSSGLPAILVDDFRNSPSNQRRVEFHIDRGYPPPDGFGLGQKEDPRTDKRISAAVKELFSEKVR